MISNRKKDKSPMNNSIDSKTMSMMNALQGKSIFGNAEESMFSTREIDKGGADVIHRI